MTSDQQTNLDISYTIRAQLGARKFETMTGARDFIAIDRGLQFRLPQHIAKNKCTHVFIELQGNDLYTVTFQRYNRAALKMHAIAKFSDVSVERLRGLFTEQTGLNTSID